MLLQIAFCLFFFKFESIGQRSLIGHKWAVSGVFLRAFTLSQNNHIKLPCLLTSVVFLVTEAD
jgi:hypothetical protein